MRIGILQLNKKSFPSFFYDWLKGLSKEKEHTFLFLGGRKKTKVASSSFVQLPFSLSHIFSKAKNFEKFFLEQQLDICFVPENFKTDIEGCLLVFVTEKGLVFKNLKKLKKIKQKKHIIITPFSFLNTNKNFDNIFTIYPPLPVLKPHKTNIDNTALKPLMHNNYLLCYCKNPNFDDVIFLLKAFSILKRKQKTKMQLVLLWEKMYPPIFNKLSEYKYKNDILLIEEKNAASLFMELIPQSYAFIFPFLEEKEMLAEQVFSLAQQVPIIGIENPLFKEIVGNAGIAVSRENIGELADALKKIYLDERFKKELSKEAQQQYKFLSFSYNVKKLKTLLYEQNEIYKNYYFQIITKKNENRKTSSSH